MGVGIKVMCGTLESDRIGKYVYKCALVALEIMLAFLSYEYMLLVHWFFHVMFISLLMIDDFLSTAMIELIGMFQLCKSFWVDYMCCSRNVVCKVTNDVWLNKNVSS